MTCQKLRSHAERGRRGSGLSRPTSGAALRVDGGVVRAIA